PQMRPLLKLNPYFAKYRWQIGLGVVFIILSNLFAVYSPEVVREAIDLIGKAIAQRDVAPAERSLEVLEILRIWVGWTEIDIERRLNDLGGEERLSAPAIWLAGSLAVLYLVFGLLKGFFMFLMRQTIIGGSRLIAYDL